MRKHNAPACPCCKPGFSCFGAWIYENGVRTGEAQNIDKVVTTLANFPDTLTIWGFRPSDPFGTSYSKWARFTFQPGTDAYTGQTHEGFSQINGEYTHTFGLEGGGPLNRACVFRGDGPEVDPFGGNLLLPFLFNNGVWQLRAGGGLLLGEVPQYFNYQCIHYFSTTASVVYYDADWSNGCPTGFGNTNSLQRVDVFFFADLNAGGLTSEFTNNGPEVDERFHSVHVVAWPVQYKWENGATVADRYFFPFHLPVIHPAPGDLNTHATSQIRMPDRPPLRIGSFETTTTILRRWRLSELDGESCLGYSAGPEYGVGSFSTSTVATA